MSWPIRMRSEYVTMSITSSRKREENKKYAAPPTGRDYPPTATGSAWMDYSILCRIWQDTGDGLPRRGFAPPRNDGTLVRWSSNGRTRRSAPTKAIVTRRRGRPLCRPVDNGCTPGKALGGGTDCRVAALLAMTGRGIDNDLKAGIMIGKRGRCSDWVSPSCGYEVTAGF